MPVLDGIGATRLLTEQHPDVAVVVLTTYVDDSSVLAALQAGARSYLTKDADCADIVQALRSAATGLSVIDPAARAALLAAAAARPESPPGQKPPGKLPDGLTLREAEILSMVARGMTNPDIAAELYISIQTIKTHVNRIFAKTGSANRADAIRYARDHHLA
jgi:DNA-binding NarL/FixJ family response regulator